MGGEPRLVYAVHAAPGHYFPNHPECPGRVQAAEAALKDAGVTGDGKAVLLSEWPLLDEETLSWVHSPEYTRGLRAQSEKCMLSQPTVVRDPDDPDGPTYATTTSYVDALKAASAAVALVDAVLAAGPHPPAGLSVCRPPGHHATASEQMGFCLLNSVALAARHAQRRHGLARVLILDYDVHHGNGSQDIFYDDPSVMFIDLHQAGVWPGSGCPEETGAGAGAGTTINVALPWHSGHAAALEAFDRVVAPAARAFRPELILVSAGYDAHWQDPLERLQLQSGTYHALAAAVAALAAEVCGGRCVFVLEGGYHLAATGESVAQTALALLGRPCTVPLLSPGALLAEPAEAALAACFDSDPSMR